MGDLARYPAELRIAVYETDGEPYRQESFTELGPDSFPSLQRQMERFPRVDDSQIALTKEVYQIFMAWAGEHGSTAFHSLVGEWLGRFVNQGMTFEFSQP